MDFIHESYQAGDTIAAIATPPGEGGVAIIRISGNYAIEVASRCFSRPVESLPTHTVHYGKIKNKEGEWIDHVLLLPMHAPRSYTGEHTVEIHCHGGSLIARRVLQTVLEAGARAARPGEFTFKAFMNGKLDLAQAEAVQELIGAKNEKALQAAGSHLQGALTRKISTFQKSLSDIAAILEAWVDFPEEGLEFASMEEIQATLKQATDAMQSLASTFHNGKILREGVSLCLIGCPNVGKSSLMNALLGKDRAIVSAIAGTTRDVLEDHLKLNGLNFRLLDTAGIRDSAEIVEAEGIRRSRQAMQEADLILFVLDASQGLQPDDHLLMQQIPPEKTIGVWNKIDIKQTELPPLPFPTVQASAQERQGLEVLQATIDEVIWKNGMPDQQEVVITSMRHLEALKGAIAFAQNVYDGLSHNLSPEFLCVDMRLCLRELGKIIGTNVTEDILSSIFSKFCIGK
ncbi:tRNA uridine-5-carboxymethylaminomethyl(34) synthesis GTPase MnmE [Parachlamydia sp. AcF125]|uniref:tRNA uridine-5-carboxymethylaminomethyl(34) synthesis GTPase MnmE n=1 Tax=Parachlamydia sp. AcF125 TaxID=2795736 RepID=UPI001BC8E37A|nr:tRNA uridine-5-carboxymethylaminomethyl(34) synthesis GTPase MnmE [Parachlamydia sp. AcF125]MBS4167641.1 tRNA modification GTPase MnmE [Parachlamydia sp. AcF125]